MSIFAISNDEPLSESTNPDPKINELDQKTWSVISFEKCEESGLAYFAAVKKRESLESRRVAGLCIVTDDAARNLSPRET